jgi:protein kinase C substrate 80K-H
MALVSKPSLGTHTHADVADVAAARSAYNDVKNALDSLRRDVTSSTAALEQIDSDFGPDAEWKKLEDTCIEKVAGEYVHEADEN